LIQLSIYKKMMSRDYTKLEEITESYKEFIEGIFVLFQAKYLI